MLANWTKVVGVFTGLLFAATIISAWVLYKTDHTLKTDQRAWLALRGAEIIRPVKVGETLEFEVVYENTGKQPAFNVGHQGSQGTMKVPLDSRGTAYWENMVLPLNTTCNAFTERIQNNRDWVGKTAFPGQKYRDVSYLFTDNIGTPDDFLNRRVTMWVQGCLGYRTLGHYSFTPYCVYLHPVRDEPPEKWPFRFCRVGNQTQSPD